MHILDLGTVPLTVLATILLAAVLIAVRVFFVQRAQRMRQREHRQQTERLRSLVMAYRALAGSFTPPVERDWRQIEEALADVVLFGTLAQVKLAAECAQTILDGEPSGYQELVVQLRNDLREQLGLEPIPADLPMPDSGPGRPPKIPGAGGGAAYAARMR